MSSITVVITWTTVKLLGPVFLILLVVCSYGLRHSPDGKHQYLFYVSKLITQTLLAVWALVFFLRGLFFVS